MDDSAIRFTVPDEPIPIITITPKGGFLIRGVPVENPLEIRDIFAEWCRTWTGSVTSYREQLETALRLACEPIARSSDQCNDPRVWFDSFLAKALEKMTHMEDEIANLDGT